MSLSRICEPFWNTKLGSAEGSPEGQNDSLVEGAHSDAKDLYSKSSPDSDRAFIDDPNPEPSKYPTNGEDVLWDQLSGRMGSLQIAEDGQLRFCKFPLSLKDSVVLDVVFVIALSTPGHANGDPQLVLLPTSTSFIMAPCLYQGPISALPPNRATICSPEQALAILSMIALRTTC